MLRALVTTVNTGPDVSGVSRRPRPSRLPPALRARARATSVVVVPPLRPTTSPSAIIPATAVAMRCFSGAWREDL